MALSNIFREPRRELTEQLVGTVLFCGLLFADYRLAKRLELVAGVDANGYHNFPWPIGMVALALGAMVAAGVLYLIHEAGEGICNALARRGLELRPKRGG